MARNMASLQQRLETMELEHLRRHVLELHNRLEQAEADLQLAMENAEFWQRYAMNIQLSLADNDHEKNLCVGITKEGEMMVIPAE